MYVKVKYYAVNETLKNVNEMLTTISLEQLQYEK